MGIERRLEQAARFSGYPEDGPSVGPLASDAIAAIGTMKFKLGQAESEVDRLAKRVAELENAIKTARANTLEEAAKIADRFWDGMVVFEARGSSDVAAAIRALPGSPS